MLIAAKADSASREYSLPSASGSPRPSAPNTRSTFQRVNIPQIDGSSNQVWRRIQAETPLGSIATDDAPSTTRMPDLTDVRRRGQTLEMPKKVRKKLSQAIEETSRNITKTYNTQRSMASSSIRDTSDSMHRGSVIRDVIKDLIVSKKPVKLPKTKVLTERENQTKQQIPQKKIKLSNKLKISPLNQELKKLEPLSIPVTTNNKQLHRRPTLVKYSHREVLAEPPRSISPSTIVDPNKPRLITKAKAQKLVLLQRTINQL